jgi:cellulose synthase/poly-beta-1,6-N-acetylglucosamine synthase-like glycosyltransferase
MKVSIVIPAFNEVQTIAEVLRRIAAANADAEIVVIDDGSTDGTRDVLHARSGITVIFHEENAGKGGQLPAEQHAERPQPDRHGDRLVWRLDEPCTALDAKREGTADASQPAA